MTVIKGSTKRGQQLLARASRFEGTDLSDVYGRYSSAKANAIRNCRELCNKMNGTNFHICSHTAQAFSVAWNYTNEETGEIMTRIETSCNTYIIDGSRPTCEFNYYLHTRTVPDPETINTGNSICYCVDSSGYSIAIIANGEPEWDEDENLISNCWYEAIYCNPDGASEYYDTVNVEGMTKAELERYCKKELTLFINTMKEKE
jgi:hypothetical protein